MQTDTNLPRGNQPGEPVSGSEKTRNWGLIFTIVLIIIGFIFLFVYTFGVDSTQAAPSQKIVISICMLVAGSALTAGGFIGFLFGIPRSVAVIEPVPEPTPGTAERRKYIGNDNLVQISDWLTKIIVGVGLTSLTKIPGYIQSMGAYIGAGIGGRGSAWAEVVAEGIVIYFSICGFMLVYLWTRLHFHKLLEEADAKYSSR